MGRVISFEYEADMCATLSKQLARLSSKRFRVMRHLQVGCEIPDYVIAFTSKTGSLPRLSALECAVLARLGSGGHLSVTNIAADLFAQPSRIATAIRRLTRLGYARCTNDQYESAGRLSSARVISIEAKLTRWRDALDQAISYGRFSNASYVALPHDVLQSRRATFVSDCASAAVGLIGVGRGRLSIEVPAPFHDTCTGDWVWAVTKSISGPIARQRTAETRRAKCADDSSSCVG